MLTPRGVQRLRPESLGWEDSRPLVIWVLQPDLGEQIIFFLLFDLGHIMWTQAVRDMQAAVIWASCNSHLCGVLKKINVLKTLRPPDSSNKKGIKCISRDQEKGSSSTKDHHLLQTRITFESTRGVVNWQLCWHSFLLKAFLPQQQAGQEECTAQGWQEYEAKKLR